MIVVEGPDGSGKTTLVRRLSTDLGIEVMPRVVSKDAEAMVDLKEWTERDVARGFGRRLYDRHRLISECIYAPGLGREWTGGGFSSYQWLANQLARFYAAEPIIIYCLPEMDICWGNVKDDPDNKVVHDRKTHDTIYRLYHARCGIDLALSKASVMVWDYNNDTDEWYDLMVHNINQRMALRGFFADA